MTVQQKTGWGEVMSRNLIGVTFWGKKSNILRLGFVLYMKNVTVSNFGALPGRSGGNCVMDSTDLPVSLEGEGFLKD